MKSLFKSLGHQTKIILQYPILTSFVELQNIPSPQKTAQKILDNFIRYRRPGKVGKRTAFEEDTVIVMDGSGSIGSCEFGEGKKAMSELMKLCEQMGSSFDCRYAAITFSSSVTKNFDFLRIAQASPKIITIHYPGRGTNTHAGLEEAEKVIRAGLYKFFGYYLVHQVSITKSYNLSSLHAFGPDILIIHRYCKYPKGI